MDNHTIIPEYSDLFDDQPLPINEYLKGIGKARLIKVLTHIIERNNTIRQPVTSIAYVHEYFSSSNNEIKIYLKNRLAKLVTDTNADYSIFPSVTILELLNRVLSYEVGDDETKKIEQVEVDFFKAVLVANTDYINKEKRMIGYLHANVKDKNLSLTYQMICSQLPISEFINYDPSKVLISQIVKSIYLFKFLEDNDITKNLLGDFYSIFRIDAWRDYIVRLLRIIQINVQDNVAIKIEHGPNYNGDIAFFERFSAFDTSVENNYDYSALRSQPIFKEGEDSYRVVYSLFLFEQIFRTIYFNLRNIHNPKLIKNFRSFYCKEFSEKYLTYNVLDTIYNKRYKKRTGEELEKQGEVGAPDYYIRNGNKVYIIESKDILFNAEIKVSMDVDLILKEVKKKLYIKENGQYVGIGQIIIVLKKLYLGEFNYDKLSRAEKVFPIIILHERLYNVPGLNKLINDWFQFELIQLRDKHGVNISNIAPVTLIDIDTLIDNKIFFEKRNDLGELINNYHEFTSRYQTKKHYKSLADSKLAYMYQFYSFAAYLNNKFPKNRAHDFAFQIERMIKN